MQFTLATLFLAASAVFAAPLAQTSRYASLGARSVVAKRNCNPMPSSIDTGVRDQIYKVVRSQTSDPKIMLITMVTAYTESMVNNLDCGDKDSLGPFQQRPSQNWGSPSELMDVTYTTKAFLSALAPLYKNSPDTPAGTLAQHVQQAEAGDQYTKNVATAAKIVLAAAASVGDGGSDPVTTKTTTTKTKTTKTHTATSSSSTDAGAGGAINVGGDPTDTGSSTPTSSEPPAPSSTGSSDDGDCDDSLPLCNAYYTPKSGDNCYKVAAKHNISLSDLYKMNPEIDDSCQNLNVGQQYCIAADDI